MLSKTTMPSMYSHSFGLTLGDYLSDYLLPTLVQCSNTYTSINNIYMRIYSLVTGSLDDSRTQERYLRFGSAVAVAVAVAEVYVEASAVLAGSCSVFFFDFGKGRNLNKLKLKKETLKGTLQNIRV